MLGWEKEGGLSKCTSLGTLDREEGRGEAVKQVGWKKVMHFTTPIMKALCSPARAIFIPHHLCYKSEHTDSAA